VNKSKWHAAQARMRLHAGLGSKTGTEMAPLLIFEVTGQSASTRCPTPPQTRINEFAPCSYSRRKASQKLVTRNAVQLSVLLEAGWIIEIGFYYIAPSCLNVFAASESGCRVRQSTSACLASRGDEPQRRLQAVARDQDSVSHRNS